MFDSPDIQVVNVERRTSCGEPGGDSGEVTPVPMPNTEVKLSSADGTWGKAPGRVGRCRAIEKQPAA